MPPQCERLNHGIMNVSWKPVGNYTRFLRRCTFLRFILVFSSNDQLVLTACYIASRIYGKLCPLFVRTCCVLWYFLRYLVCGSLKKVFTKEFFGKGLVIKLSELVMIISAFFFCKLKEHNTYKIQKKKQAAHWKIT